MNCLLVSSDAEERLKKWEGELRMARQGLGKMCDWLMANCAKMGISVEVWQIDYTTNVNAQVENIL